jgi:site-specific DNA-methyltransferase (cytosine-N4-specific)
LQETHSLSDVDWAFSGDGEAEHPVHRLHSYPAKFVPALPREIIKRLSGPGDLVADPFCGSGTALVEALLLGRKAIGGDINPVALAATRAKTRRLHPEQLLRLTTLEAELPSAVKEARARGDVALPQSWHPTPGRRFRGLSFWFTEEIALELSAIRSVLAAEADEDVRQVALTCFSSIIVAVSHQDSDTRYVRRAKSVAVGDPTKLLVRRLAGAREALDALRKEVTSSAAVRACDARTIDYLPPESVRLVVTSPPYPNAWSYHLYHQNRILWLDEDPWAFKESEIGHHRAYSAKGGSDAADFERDMQQTFRSLAPALGSDAHVVVVVGDSIVRGDVVRNDVTVTAGASREGFRLAANFNRVIDPRRKAFNPAIGKIRTEHILVFDAPN